MSKSFITKFIPFGWNVKLTSYSIVVELVQALPERGNVSLVSEYYVIVH